MRAGGWLAMAAVALAHGDTKVNPDDSWQVRHMKIEHGVDEFDAHSFFTLHDNDNSGTWNKNDILNLYGILKDEQVGDGTGIGQNDEEKAIQEKTKDTVYQKILELVDTNGDGLVSKDEWRMFCEAGKELPDFGLGAGHHGDYEYEYEVHHWREFHAENDPDVKIRHPEDEEHDRLYHHLEHGDEPGDADGAWALVSRIPPKFLKQRNNAPK